MNEYSKTEFAQLLLEAHPHQRLPLFGTLELTFRCNLLCRHCYSLDGKAQEEMSLEEIEEVLDQLASSGCLWLQLTGGEVAVRKDFPDIYKAAKRRGFLVTVFTNGTLLQDEMVKLFEELPPYRVEITFHSIRSTTFDDITQIHGSFERCLRLIMRLHHARIPLVLKAVGMTLNQEDLAETYTWACKQGISFKFDTTLIPTLGGSLAPYQYQLSSSRITELDEIDPERKTAKMEAAARRLNDEKVEYRYDACGAGVNTFNIDPEGFMTICALARHMKFDIKNGKFQEIWNRFFPRVLEEPRLPSDTTWKGAKIGCPAVVAIEQKAI